MLTEEFLLEIQKRIRLRHEGKKQERKKIYLFQKKKKVKMLRIVTSKYNSIRRTPSRSKNLTRWVIVSCDATYPLRTAPRCNYGYCSFIHDLLSNQFDCYHTIVCVHPSEQTLLSAESLQSPHTDDHTQLVS